ncbi:MAG: class I SAM-dependent methyltransferase [Candidatus Marinimicrobia bacterium]|nr:class I SAM-dependent methyltransferase [Candidatus Neomarinimicrobiota bacterium]
MSKEKELWMKSTIALEKQDTFQLGPYFTHYVRHDPKHLCFTLSRYKFISKMLNPGGSVIELGCSDGLGTMILRQVSQHVTAVDFDHRVIEWAKGHLEDDGIQFYQDDILNLDKGEFDAVVSLDVIEHIYLENADVFLKAVVRHLKENGVAIVGTPNITAEKYATKNEQHVNLYTGERLKDTFQKYFHNVFLFGMNDEVLHTGNINMCHYLFVLCCNLKKGA